MSASANEFDSNITKWKQEMALPWAKLKYKIGHANLIKHIGDSPMRILDAGGGNGLDSIPFAKLGHDVDIVDFSQEMLSDAKQEAKNGGFQQYITTHLADIHNSTALFPENTFDLILCHNVLQYVQGIPAILESFARLLKPHGLVSILSTNRYSKPFHAAFLENDLAKALTDLDTPNATGKIFTTQATYYSVDEMTELLKNAGLIHQADYGIRCVIDYWGDNEQKSDPLIFQQIEALEFALTDRHPYKLLARHFQVIAKKE